MRILCTFPGKFGDILWALPTMRAIAEAYAQPVEFLTSAKYQAITGLVNQQLYIGCVGFDPAWSVIESAPMSPRVPPGAEEYRRGDPPYYDAVYHLGYDGWPAPTLAEDIYRRAKQQYEATRGRAFATLDLTTPWITTPGVEVCPFSQPTVWVAWSEEYFELKIGILACLAARFPQLAFLWIRPTHGGRYDEIDKQQQLEGMVQPQHRLGGNVAMARAGWRLAAQLAQGCRCYLGCLSSQWVLANALGIPTAIAEPNPQRHHPVFWRDSPLNTLVLGNDGKPTFDARHVGDAIEVVLGDAARGAGRAAPITVFSNYPTGGR